MSKLCMIGTYHYDRKGEEHIKSALSAFRPDHVIIEGSESLHEAQKIAMDEYVSTLKGHVIPNDISTLLLDEQERKHHEDRAVRKYCSENGTSFSYFGDTLESRNEEEIRKFTRESIKRVLSQHADDRVLLKDMLEVRTQLQNFVLGLGLAFKLVGNTENEFVITDSLPNYQKNTVTRDPLMYQALESHARENPQQKIATVTGTVHIFEDKNRNSLYCRAKDAGMEPIRKIPVLGVE